MRELWTGEIVTRHGTHYTTENAQIYTTPDGDGPGARVGLRAGGRRAGRGASAMASS